jgi:hypothetical protein
MHCTHMNSNIAMRLLFAYLETISEYVLVYFFIIGFCILLRGILNY